MMHTRIRNTCSNLFDDFFYINHLIPDPIYTCKVETKMHHTFSFTVLKERVILLDEIRNLHPVNLGILYMELTILQIRNN